MANILSTDFNYTYDGKLSTDVLIKPSIMTPDVLALFTVYPEVKYKQPISLTGTLEKITKAYAGCSRTLTGTGIDITNRTLETKQLEIFIEQCSDAFEATILSQALKSGIDYNDLQGTDIEKIINTLTVDAMRRDLFRIISFGDTASLSADYSMLDGIWVNLINGVGSGCIKQSSVSLTGALASGAAFSALKDMYDNAPIILKQVENSKKAFYVTGSVYLNLLASYESLDSGSDAQFALVQDGESKLKFRGIDVIPFWAWDASLQADSPLDVVAGSAVDNLILYTTPENHAIGIEKAADQGTVDMWYERKDRKVYTEGMYKIGYTYLHCDLQMIAF
jgi:hypothetical protein